MDQSSHTPGDHIIWSSYLISVCLCNWTFVKCHLEMQKRDPYSSQCCL